MTEECLFLESSCQYCCLVSLTLCSYLLQNSLATSQGLPLQTFGHSQYAQFPQATCFSKSCGTGFCPFHKSSFSSEVLLELCFQTQELISQQSSAILAEIAVPKTHPLCVSSCTQDPRTLPNFSSPGLQELTFPFTNRQKQQCSHLSFSVRSNLPNPEPYLLVP